MNKPNPNYTYLFNHVPKQRVTLLQGGTRSGKSWSIIFYIIWLCKSYKGIEIDVCRVTFRSLKSTFMSDFFNVLIRYKLYHPELHNKTDHIYILNGNRIRFYGTDNPEAVFGGSRDFLVANEAQQFKEAAIDQLFPRTRHRIICDYNPALEDDHWLDRYIPDYPPFISTYLDNPHLTKSQILEIESRKNNPVWWPVFGTGKRTKPVGVIFQDYKEGKFPEHLPYIYGQDYGFMPDPTTLVKVAVDERLKKIHLDEQFGEQNLSSGAIAKLNNAITHGRLIVGDSAEPRLIKELQKAGNNIVRADKSGTDYVATGIRSMLDYELVVTPQSVHLKKELNKYRWVDKKSGVPIDAWNHYIDASRYAFEYLTRGRGSYAIHTA